MKLAAPAAKAAAAAHMKQAPAARPAPTHAAAPARAAARATGMFADSLNNLSDAEQRARDVAGRRQADAERYTAFVIGQQGKLAAVGQAADQRAVQQTAGIQAATLAGNAGLGRGLQAAREAQGIGGTVPSQQIAGLADDAARQNLILGAATQRSSDRANTNAGKAGFASAAALAAMTASQRAIAGDEFDQVSSIRREKTGILAQRDQAAADQRAAQAQAQADMREAELRAQQAAADRASREDIAGARIASSESTAAARRRLDAQQGKANRRVRLRTSAQGAAALGYVDPKETRRRAGAVRDIESQRDAAVANAREAVSSAKANGLKVTPDAVRSYVLSTMKGAPREVIDYALAAAMGSAAGTAHGKSNARRRYYAYLNKVKRGQA